MTDHESSDAPPSDLDEVVKKLREREPYLRRKYGLLSVGIFGSLVRGEARPGSDLDLLVEFDDRPLSLFEFIALQNELTDLLGMKVDLVEKAVLKPRIGRRILDEVIYV
jgi:uncharacterized protein